MSAELSARQTVPLSEDERARLRRLAADLGTSPGLLARALILDGLENVKDPQLRARIEEEKKAAHARASAAGRAAMDVRYGRTQTAPDGEEETP